MKAKPILKKLGKGLAWAIWTCGVLLVVQFLLSLVLSWLFKILPFHISSAVAQTIFALISYTVSILIIFIVPTKIKRAKISPVSKSELGLNELPTWTDIGLAPVGLIIYAFLAAFLNALFSIFPWYNAEQTQDVGFNNLFVTSDRIFAFITLVIIAPIAEELIFRGFLYKRIKNLFYKKDKKREYAAIAIATLITSVAFGAMHGQWNVGINVFAMSIILCIMREITGSIYSGIIFHMIKNMIAFYLLYIATIGF